MVGTIIAQKRAGERAQNAARPQGECLPQPGTHAPSDGMAEPLVWRFGSPHHFCSEPEMRTSEPKPHEINKLLVSFDPEVRNRGTGTMMRTSASGHACIDHRSAEPGMGRGALS